MAFWALRGVLRGVVTTRYPTPSEHDRWAATLPSPPVVVPSRLSLDVADRVVAVCPSRALRREPAALVLDLGACTGCGACMRAAPGALRPSGQIELSARRREDLLKRFPVPGSAR
jgi:NAD-dependent dihydropyrimidine dehydrogenase PreA subunit